MDSSRDLVLREMSVAGIVLDQKSKNPVVVLKDPKSLKALPIWIGNPEASSIASVLNKMSLPRPMTHDLLVNVIKDSGAHVSSVSITDLVEGTYFASIELLADDAIKEIDARPSDAIAVALRLNLPIFVSEEVLEQAQVTLLAIDKNQVENLEVQEGNFIESEMGENFQSVSKEHWEEMLAEMEPGDFKYKM